MRELISAALVLACAAGIAGCVTDSPGRGGRDSAPGVAPADTAAVAEGVDTFLREVVKRDYEAIRAMVEPGEAEGFDAKGFVENRFRMEIDSFEVYAWDLSRVGVTRVKTSGRLLSSIVVTARVLKTNEAAKVYVNLYWERARGKWWIVPFPDAK